MTVRSTLIEYDFNNSFRFIKGLFCVRHYIKCFGNFEDEVNTTYLPKDLQCNKIDKHEKI